MQRIARLTLTFCAMLALTASPAFAQSFVIFSARHDAAARQVVLVGAGFRADMRILLNGALLPNAARAWTSWLPWANTSCRLPVRWAWR